MRAARQLIVLGIVWGVLASCGNAGPRTETVAEPENESAPTPTAAPTTTTTAPKTTTTARSEWLPTARRRKLGGAAAARAV